MTILVFDALANANFNPQRYLADLQHLSIWEANSLRVRIVCICQVTAGHRLLLFSLR